MTDKTASSHLRRWGAVFCIIAGICSCANHAAIAANASSTGFQDFSEVSLDDLLNQVVVTAARHEQRLSDSPMTTHVITEEEIRLSPAITLADLLRMVPGFQSKTWLSQFTNTSIRGMLGASVINERILWMVDGVPINDVRDGGIWTDITSIPLSNIKRIEVLSGPGSPLYGSNAFLGVVHILTKSPDDYLKHGLTGQAQVSYGTFDTSINSLAVAGRNGRAKWLWTADGGTTRGPGLVRDRNRPGEAKHTDRMWGFLRGKYEWGNHKVQVGARRVLQDYDGADFAVYRLYTWGRDEKWLDWHFRQPRGQKIEDSFVFSWHAFNEHFYDFADVPDLTYDIRSYRLYFNLQRDIQYRKHRLSIGTGLRSESYHGDDFYPDKRSILKENWNLFFQDLYKFDSRWSLSFGGRYDTHPNYDNIFSPHASLMHSFDSQRGKVRLTHGRAFKEPSNWQSYIDQPSGKGTPDMTPEKLQANELAIEYTFPRELRLGATLFSFRHENIIWENFDPVVADPAYARYGILGKFHPQQPGDDAKIKGIEFEVQKRFSPKTRLFSNFVWLSSKDSRERDLQYDAPRMISAGIWHTLNHRTSLHLVHHHVAETTDTNLAHVPGIGVRTVEAYSITGASLNLKLSERERIKLSAWNLGRGTYEEMIGAPVPGTTVHCEYTRHF
ncbi:MAG TPA: TonB-dependent receptor [Candidatus Ozemobacteraceae bacterium]|nr:TonB-dependent receptor [Candidatus Ozemobacteraceae bacterium]